MIDKKLFFLTHELLLINTCCWRADHKILIHDGKNWSELIFVSAQQQVLINDNSPVRKNYMDSDIKQNENARVLQHLQMDSFEADIANVYIQCHQPKYMLSVNSMNNHKVSHGTASYTLSGKNVNIMLEFIFATPCRYTTNFCKSTSVAYSFDLHNNYTMIS